MVNLNILNVNISKNYLLSGDFAVASLNNHLEDNRISINFVGDCTLGTGANYSYKRSFIEKYDNVKDDNYFFANFQSLFDNDDLTIANLEGVLSDNANDRVLKTYNYKGPSSYATILLKGNIDAVNLANNHTYDYGFGGYSDTKKSLESENIVYFGKDIYKIINMKNKKIGLAGIEAWGYSSAKSQIDSAIDYFKKNNTDIIIFNFHWGNMYEQHFNSLQESIAHYAVDSGATIVVGHHPHIIQGIEKYNNKYIAYSLGNFVYGGIYNTKETDSMVLNVSFDIYDNGVLSDPMINIIPASITSTGTSINNYQPMMLDGSEKERVIKKILSLSKNVDYY